MSTEGNKLAAALYNEHKKSLQSYVRRRVPGADAAHTEDIVQETFARTITHLNKGKAVDSPKGFLFITARNLITSMFYRRPDYAKTDPTEDMDEYAADASTGSPQRSAAVHQQLAALSVAISELPDHYQEAFVRKRIWGQSCREIAAVMGIGEPTVSNYVAHGWRMLNEYCEEHDIALKSVADL